MMTKSPASTGVLSQPIYTLTKFFCLWKIVLLLVVLASPGPGYDTSTVLLLSPVEEGAANSASIARQLISHVALKLSRWDAIYFLSSAQRGYVFEQEWAFGYGYTNLLALLLPESLRSLQNLAVAGVVLSHVCHYLSVLVLYRLSQATFKGDTQNALPFLASALHIISPAGAFLSAPYTEALFAFLNFLGCYLYVTALNDERRGRLNLRDAKLLSAGVLFATATTVRGNGVLSGLLFVYDALFGLHQIITHGLTRNAFRRLFMVGAGGSFILVGAIGPQYVAYQDFCLTEDPRPWCSRLVPSIFAWVQTYYWNVGFLRYWVFSNLPLFCIAAPMIVILTYSGVRVLLQLWSEQDTGDSDTHHSMGIQARLALPQVVLALLAITNYHIQIVNRISSGYPLWYLFLASCMVGEKTQSGILPNWLSSHTIPRAMVLYGLIQAATEADEGSSPTAPASRFVASGRLGR